MFYLLFESFIYYIDTRLPSPTPPRSSSTSLCSQLHVLSLSQTNKQANKCENPNQQQPQWTRGVWLTSYGRGPALDCGYHSQYYSLKTSGFPSPSSYQLKCLLARDGTLWQPLLPCDGILSDLSCVVFICVCVCMRSETGSPYVALAGVAFTR